MCSSEAPDGAAQSDASLQSSPPNTLCVLPHLASIESWPRTQRAALFIDSAQNSVRLRRVQAAEGFSISICEHASACKLPASERAVHGARQISLQITPAAPNPPLRAGQISSLALPAPQLDSPSVFLFRAKGEKTALTSTRDLRVAAGRRRRTKVCCLSTQIRRNNVANVILLKLSLRWRSES